MYKLIYLVFIFTLTNIFEVKAEQPPLASPQPLQQQTQTLPPQPGAPTAPDPVLQQAIQASLQAANAWLQIVDQGAYSNSWDASSLVMRLTMSRKEWIQTLTATRAPLGRVIQRQLADVRPAQDPKGLARGNYMVLIYDTSFANGRQAKEILTLQQTTGGNWRVLTYLISVVK